MSTFNPLIQNGFIPLRRKFDEDGSVKEERNYSYSNVEYYDTLKAGV
jgi:hypothetical protein